MKAFIYALTALSLTVASTSTRAQAPAPTADPSTEGNIAQSNEGNASQDVELSPLDYRKLGFTSAADMQNYFTVTNVRIEKSTRRLSKRELKSLFKGPITGIPVNAASAPPAAAQLPPVVAAPVPSQAPAPTGGSGPGDQLTQIVSELTSGELDRWIVLGQKVWQVIVDGQAVSNVSSQRFSVLPVTQQDWAQMENWKTPIAQTFRVKVENLYGITVVDHTYTIAFNYGGQLGGHGAFIANATMIPTVNSVAWGFRLDSQVEIGTIVNTGTKLDPRPGVDLQVKWKVEPIIRLKTLSGTESFFLRGDGTIVHVNGAR